MLKDRLSVAICGLDVGLLVLALELGRLDSDLDIFTCLAHGTVIIPFDKRWVCSFVSYLCLIHPFIFLNKLNYNIEALIQEVDEDGSGEIEFDEFKEMLVIKNYVEDDDNMFRFDYSVKFLDDNWLYSDKIPSHFVPYAQVQMLNSSSLIFQVEFEKEAVWLNL